MSGELPCHLAIDPAGRWLASAQYVSGDVTLFPLDADGYPRRAVSTVRFDGRGPDTDRQASSHAHQVSFDEDGSTLCITDLGSDRLRCLVLDRRANGLTEVADGRVTMPAGCGPRHLVRSADGRTIIVANELDETLSVLRRERDSWQHECTHPVFDDRTCRDGSLAAIRLSSDERYVYVSGRRQDKIAWFEFDAATGTLRRAGRARSGGALPRDFIVTPDGRWAVVANQGSDLVTCLPRDGTTGDLGTVSDAVTVPSPAAVLAW